MLQEKLIKRLVDKLGSRNVYHEKEDLLVYGYDSTPSLQYLPDIAVFPSSEEDLIFAMTLANEEGLPIVPRGSGTGLSGGSIPVNGGMVIGLTRLNRILEIDDENLTATAQTGVITLDFFNAVAVRGLFYPPDPASQQVSTLGGNVAENAGGLRGLKYGVTRNYVMGLRGFLADGTPFSTGGKCVKDVAGYSLRDLLVGSEGTLGIVTEITFRLITPPKDKRTFLAYLQDIRTAGDAVSQIIAAHIIPSTLEIMDKTTINCVEDYKAIGLPRQMESLLFIEVDGHPATVKEDADRVKDILVRLGADEIREARSAKEAFQLAEARRTALAAVARVSPTTILEDTTVPRSELADLFGEIERLKVKYGIKVATFGHAGDGNVHPTALADERNHEEMRKVHAFFDELYSWVLAKGGTVSGEHGIGISKRIYLEHQVGKGGILLMKRIKNAFDPKGLLNPGKLFLDVPGNARPNLALGGSNA